MQIRSCAIEAAFQDWRRYALYSISSIFGLQNPLTAAILGMLDLRSAHLKPAARVMVLRVTGETNILVSGHNFTGSELAHRGWGIRLRLS